MRPFSNIIGQLSDKTDGMANAQKAAALSTIFGTEAVSGMLAVIEAGPEKLNKLTKGLVESGGASKEAADKMKDNLKGAVEELGGAFETAAITIGEIITPAIQKATKFIQGLVEKFQDAAPETQKFIVIMGGIVAAIGPILTVGGTFLAMLGSIASGVGALLPLIGGAGGLTAVIGAMAGPIGLTVAALALLGGGMIALNDAMDEPIVKSDIFAGDYFKCNQRSVW